MFYVVLVDLIFNQARWDKDHIEGIRCLDAYKRIPFQRGEN